MTLRTRFTELVGIEHPIVQGGMMGVGLAEPTCRELIERIIHDAEAIIRSRLASLIES